MDDIKVERYSGDEADSDRELDVNSVKDSGAPVLSDFPPLRNATVGMPSCISRTLAVRQSVIDYEASDYVASSERDDFTDLELKYSPSDVACVISRRFSPVQSYPCHAGDGVLSFDLDVRVSKHKPLEVVDALLGSGTSWVLSDRKLVDWKAGRLKGIENLYKEPPLHVYTGISLRELELVDYGTRELWSRLYGEMISMPRKHNIYGTISNNCYVDVRPYEDYDEYSVKIDLGRREFKESWRGFIDPGYTVSSVDAGRIRALVHKVRIRVMTPELIMKAKSIIEAMSLPGSTNVGDSWTLYFMGSKMRVSESGVQNAVGTWRSMRGHSTPSLHVFRTRKLVTLSVASGCLVRPLSVLDDLECSTLDSVIWVDSMVFNSQELRSSLMIPIDMPQCTLEYTSTFNLTAPFVLWNEWPRPTLAFNMSSQSIALPYTSILSTVAPKVTSTPLVLTPLMDIVRKQIESGGHNFDIPGRNMIVLFANFSYTYEDSVIVSSEAAAKFACRGQIIHPMPPEVKAIPPGTVINSKTHKWWRSGDEGIAISQGFSKTKGGQIVARVNSEGLRVGDKIATQHGQKQTVSKVLDPDDMPTCYDRDRNKSFKPDMIVASSSIHNRGTPGQIYEARAGMKALESEERGLESSSYITSITGKDALHLEAYECIFTHVGSDKPVMSALEPGQQCVADYGACRVWALAHMSRDKQHFLSSVPKGTRVPTGKLSGSSVRIGEMELATMLSKGWVATASEVLDSSDQASVSICSGCSRLTLLCDCPPSSDTPTDMTVVVRSELAKLDVCRAVYTINGSHTYAGPASIAESSTYGGGEGKAPKVIRPVSFKYRT